MAKLIDISNFIDELAPTNLRCAWDNDGLQVCKNTDCEINNILFCLDVTDDVIKEAKKMKAELIISHHPLIFSPISAINCNVPEAKLSIELISSGISLISAHTRLDRAEHGVNRLLAETIGLKNIETFGEDNIGLIGTIENTTCKELAKITKSKLKVPGVSYVLGNKKVKKVAVVCGSGKEYANEALKKGADVLITGDISYTAHTLAYRLGIAMIDAGHFYTEIPILYKLRDRITDQFPNIKSKIFTKNFVEVL